MKQLPRLLMVFFLLGCGHVLYARHVKGGHIEYTYNGPGAASGTSNYTFTVTVFFSCTTSGPKTAVYLGVFDAGTNAPVLTKLINTTTSRTVTKTSVNPCMSNPPTICYEIYTYVYTTDIPNNTAGYILSVQDALRIDGIVNITGSSSDGITITATMPGVYQRHRLPYQQQPNFYF